MRIQDTSAHVLAFMPVGRPAELGVLYTVYRESGKPKNGEGTRPLAEFDERAEVLGCTSRYARGITSDFAAIDDMPLGGRGMALTALETCT
jgi:hypothetical protein